MTDPIILGGAANQKIMPIAITVMPELRAAHDKVEETRKAGQMIGYQLVLLLGTVVAIAPQAAVNEKAFGEILTKVAALHGVNVNAITSIDWEKGQMILE